MKCPSCNGRGRIEHGMFEIACSICCGTGEIQNKERKTNFDKITASPETLAKYICETFEHHVCFGCPIPIRKDICHLTNWLKQECEE